MKPSLTPAARRVLNRALGIMQRFPKTVDMDIWLAHSESVRPSKSAPKPYCGTVACLAGHIVLAAGIKADTDVIDASTIPKQWREDDEGYDEGYVSVAQTAQKILGLDSGQRAILFSTSGWPNDFAVRYQRAKTARTRAKVTIERVRHWLKTGA